MINNNGKRNKLQNGTDDNFVTLATFPTALI